MGFAIWKKMYLFPFLQPQLLTFDEFWFLTFAKDQKKAAQYVFLWIPYVSSHWPLHFQDCFCFLQNACRRMLSTWKIRQYMFLRWKKKRIWKAFKHFEHVRYVYPHQNVGCLNLLCLFLNSFSGSVYSGAVTYRIINPKHKMWLGPEVGDMSWQH